jgi:hypothetical protein
MPDSGQLKVPFNKAAPFSTGVDTLLMTIKPDAAGWR